MYCSKCGAVVSDNGVCQTCGTVNKAETKTAFSNGVCQSWGEVNKAETKPAFSIAETGDVNFGRYNLLDTLLAICLVAGFIVDIALTKFLDVTIFKSMFGPHTVVASFITFVVLAFLTFVGYVVLSLFVKFMRDSAEMNVRLGFICKQYAGKSGR
ncbi:hypothetical protein FACS1894133_1560 [Clostridia bacterium]|nr:hypothetical protein FACS1894133_1560 [Clostridia bacterium]